MTKVLESTLVKKPYIRLPYSDKQLTELSCCLDNVNGPLYFMSNFFYIQHPLRGRIQFEPFDYQIELIENYHNNRFSINMLGRQMGKTTCAAGYLLWFAMFIPDSTMIVNVVMYSLVVAVSHLWITTYGN
jgi:hypothetical protein